MRLRDDEQNILAATDVGRYRLSNALVDALEKAIEGSVHESLQLPLGRQFGPQVPKPLIDHAGLVQAEGREAYRILVVVLRIGPMQPRQTL